MGRVRGTREVRGGGGRKVSRFPPTPHTRPHSCDAALSRDARFGGVRRSGAEVQLGESETSPPSSGARTNISALMGVDVVLREEGSHLAAGDVLDDLELDAPCRLKDQRRSRALELRADVVRVQIGHYQAPTTALEPTRSSCAEGTGSGLFAGKRLEQADCWSVKDRSGCRKTPSSSSDSANAFCRYLARATLDPFPTRPSSEGRRTCFALQDLTQVHWSQPLRPEPRPVSARAFPPIPASVRCSTKREVRGVRQSSRRRRPHFGAAAASSSGYLVAAARAFTRPLP